MNQRQIQVLCQLEIVRDRVAARARERRRGNLPPQQRQDPPPNDASINSFQELGSAMLDKIRRFLDQESRSGKPFLVPNRFLFKGRGPRLRAFLRP